MSITVSIAPLPEPFRQQPTPESPLSGSLVKCLSRRCGPQALRYSARNRPFTQGLRSTALLNPVLNLEILDTTDSRVLCGLAS